jgi:hypothetical protein
MLNDASSASRRVEIDLSSIQCVAWRQAASFDATRRSAYCEPSLTQNTYTFNHSQWRTLVSLEVCCLATSEASAICTIALIAWENCPVVGKRYSFSYFQEGRGPVSDSLGKTQE